MPVSLPEAAADLLRRLRLEKPLVHHVTNLVTVNDVAAATLATGALPVMAIAPEEVEEVAGQASCLVLNLGTPTRDRLAAMAAAGRQASGRGVPVVVDPVGAGTSRMRSEAARRLLRELRVTVVRANPAEMAHLAGRPAVLRGVESVASAGPPEEAAAAVARAYGVVAAVTGSRDWVTDSSRFVAVDNGHPMLKQVVGSGCMATAVVACFVAVGDDPLVAAAAGLAYLGYAAELASLEARGPGTFRAALLDRLAQVQPGDLRAGVRAQEVQPDAV